MYYVEEKIRGKYTRSAVGHMWEKKEDARRQLGELRNRYHNRIFRLHSEQPEGVMTEQEYIDATNLSKVRIAKHVVRDMLDMRKKETKWRTALLAALSDWEAYLEKLVSLEESP